MTKEIFFKTFFSKKIGTGHFHRTINLAKSLSKKNTNIYFLVNQVFLKKKITKENFKLKFIKKIYFFRNNQSEIKFLKKNNISNIIVDDPNFNYNQQVKYKKFIKKRMFIYQDTPKKNFADVVINHNYIKNSKRIYKRLSKNNPRLLVGIKYFPKKNLNIPRKKVMKIKKILIFFGGLPNDKILKFVLNILSKKYKEKIHINCFIGIFNKQFYSFKKNYRKIIFYKTKKQLIYLKHLHRSDLFIGSGGTSLMESLTFGIPSFVFCTAKNQLNNCRNFSKDKSIIFIKDKKLFEKKFMNLYLNVKKLNKIKVNALKFSNKIGSKNLTDELFKLIN